MKKLISFLFILTVFFSVQAQDVVVSEQVSDTVKQKTFGPNLKHYVYTVYSFGFSPTSSMDQISQKQLDQTWHFQIGIRYKYRMNRTFSLGSDIYYSNINFQFDETMPIDIGLENEIISLGSWGLAPYLRINLDSHRGNSLGRFFDLGVYGEWIPFRQYSYEYSNETLDPFLTYSDTKTVSYNKLNFIENIAYGAKFRAGMNKVVLYFDYRLNNLVNDSPLPSYLEGFMVPNYVIGLELAL